MRHFHKNLMLPLGLATCAVIVTGYLLSFPDAQFRSSDGGWADTEDQAKGRTFDTVVWNFEGYKLKCNAPKAVLVRTTKQTWFNIFAWRSYLTNPKWRVPYSDAHPEIGYYYPPADAVHCYNGGWSEEVISAADRNAAKYIASLEQ
ncbi:MAG: hypothetical protein GC166_05345 [Alphaproteobacteria bacterium]|nr:hypothetical protein [Alphaproteobacteria bacterium]